MSRRTFFPAEAEPATHQTMACARARWRSLCGDVLRYRLETVERQADMRKQRANRVLTEMRRQKAMWRECTRSLPLWAPIVRDWHVEPLKHIHAHARAYDILVEDLKDRWVVQAEENDDLHLELLNTGARNTAWGRGGRQRGGRWARWVRLWAAGARPASE